MKTIRASSTALAVKPPLDATSRTDQLASNIRQYTVDADSHARSAVESARLAGAALLEAKREIPHGDWAAFVMDGCGLTMRTASAYMRVARMMPGLTMANRQRVAEMPLRKALGALSRPRSVKVARASAEEIELVEDALVNLVRSADILLSRLSRRDVPSEQQIARLREQLRQAVSALGLLDVPLRAAA